MAQDFFAAFGRDGVGTIGTPTTINSGDMAGILMIAVQGLEKRTAEQTEEIKNLRPKMLSSRPGWRRWSEGLKFSGLILKKSRADARDLEPKDDVVTHHQSSFSKRT